MLIGGITKWQRKAHDVFAISVYVVSEDAAQTLLAEDGAGSKYGKEKENKISIVHVSTP